jgi:hypothetical protein
LGERRIIDKHTTKNKIEINSPFDRINAVRGYEGFTSNVQPLTSNPTKKGGAA